MSGTCLRHLALATALVAAGAAQGAPRFYTAPLDGASESPPVQTDGIGFGVVMLDTTQSTLRVQAGFSGLTGTVTVAHIHCCTAEPGVGTAAVASMTPTFEGFPAGVTAGDYDRTFDMLQAGSWNATFVANNGGTPATALAALKAGLDAGSAYLNIHTIFAPGGEIRGFLLLSDEIFADGFED